MAARHNEHLGPQFYSGEALANLHASDFAGTIGHRDAESRLLEHNTEIFGSRERAQAHLDGVRDAVSESGGHINEPASVVHFPTGPPRLWDGHHRALTAHQFDGVLEARHYTLDEVTRRG